MMNILPRFDIPTIEAAIKTDFPHLKVHSVSLLEHGWDNVVALVNDALVFRFPRDEEANFDLELKVLDALHGKVTLQIPQVEYLGKTYTYMGYDMVRGVPLTHEIYASLTEAEREKLISDLATFLYEVHQAISPEQARSMGVIDEDLASYSAMVRKVLPERMTDKVVLDFMEATLKEYENMILEPVIQVFLYNDLHTENMAFDVNRKRLNGVFDFGDIMVGDVNMDFYSLYRFDPFVMKAVAEKYQELSGRELSLRRMVIYGRITELCDLAEKIDMPESLVYMNAVARVRAWSAEANLFI